MILRSVTSSVPVCCRRHRPASSVYHRLRSFLYLTSGLSPGHSARVREKRKSGAAGHISRCHCSVITHTRTHQSSPYCCHCSETRHSHGRAVCPPSSCTAQRRRGVAACAALRHSWFSATGTPICVCKWQGSKSRSRVGGRLWSARALRRPAAGRPAPFEYFACI
jgi:hypothetical protein